MKLSHRLKIAYVAAALALGCSGSGGDGGADTDALGGSGGESETGGSGSGGDATTGGSNTGGGSTGGAPSGGGDTGGAATGGAATGGDGTGGTTAPDADEDGVADENDNCPAAFNKGQIDQDGDQVGDLCDETPCPSGTCLHACDALREAGATADGEYVIHPVDKNVPAYCDMTTDGGGWTLVLNYLNQGGKQSQLSFRHDSFPLLSNGSLGDDEAATAYWGHTTPALFASLGATQTRFYAITDAHERVIHFNTLACATYFGTGVGSCDLQELFDGSVALSGHDAYVPSYADSVYGDQGEYAMTEFPFYMSYNYHWGISGSGHRWEVDDFTDGFSANTWHQVWVRGGDFDEDGVADTEDECPRDPSGSTDVDSDGVCDSTDGDSDNDGTPDVDDAFPLDPAEQLDTDTDGIGNNADTNDDEDGALDEEDAFPLDPAEQADSDNDGIGNNAESDDDDDGEPDVSDNCPLVSNAAQSDADDDGTGDDCDDTACGVACYRNCKLLRESGTTQDGTYLIKPNGMPIMLAQCDMTTLNVGWTLVLNYLHKGGTNPPLDVRTTDLPLLGQGTLGDDESGTPHWGHAGNGLFASLGAGMVRFRGVTNGHSRVLHFATDACNNYFASGQGNCVTWPLTTGSYAFPDHTGFLPNAVDYAFVSQGAYAMTNFPFYQSGTYHWGIAGSGHRWEVDDFVADNSANHTWHQIWAL